MDKQNQIEDKKQLIEILKNSKDIVSYQPNAREIPFWGSDKRKFFIQDDNGHLTIHFDKIVDEIYKQGYQKVDEGSVVLTEEKFNEFREDSAKVKFLKKEIEKQAIREFSEMLKNQFEHCVGDVYPAYRIDEKINELAKEFGVEI